MPTYVTTPIYYVNAKPHIGHCYTTVISDVVARFHRMAGEDVFFLTGTDEHADKIVTSALANDSTPQAWADRHAQAFREAFDVMDCSHDDFIRTSEPRHIERVQGYIRRLQASGDVYLGDYTGWYDEGQEEYVTENAAKEQDYVSAITGKPLVKRTEKNYFFRLSAYQARLLEDLEAHPEHVMPDGKRSEVLGRLREPLQDIPISRAVQEGDPDWGILMPDDPSHRIYVWIDALFNYLSTVDTPERRHYWPATVHVVAKDIIWFHAVIWPCLLMALGEELPRMLYVHSWWVMRDRKMSKSEGNVVTIEDLEGYAARCSLDGLRWFLATKGPLGATDSDFAEDILVETYNADLANGIGNATSRVGNMVAKYFDGSLPEASATTFEGTTDDGAYAYDWIAITSDAVEQAIERMGRFDVHGALQQGSAIVRKVDAFINHTRPFSIAKQDPDAPWGMKMTNREALGTILYQCAEALRIASLLFSPAMPTKMGDLQDLWGCRPTGPLREEGAWGGLKAGASITKGDPLFMRLE